MKNVSLYSPVSGEFYSDSSVSITVMLTSDGVAAKRHFFLKVLLAASVIGTLASD